MQTVITNAGTWLKRFQFGTLACAALALLPANAQPENDNFAAATEISDTWGSIQGDTTDATAEMGEPSHAGLFPEASVWYRWTAPNDGEVQFDTLGTGATNDTVLAVYTGASAETLTQMAANDDLYRNSQQNETGQYIFKFDPADPSTRPVVKTISADYEQPYSGPSLVRFNAKAGTTYYIAVSSKQFALHYTGVGFGGLGNPYLFTQPGPFTLNWAYHPSGVFRFASEDIDQTGVQNEDGTPMLLHKVSETEAYRRPSGSYSANQFNSTVHTYYYYDAPGALLTITRVGGASGRVTLDYTTEDGDANVITNGDMPALEYTDYSPVSGTLVFDDYEMSKTIFIPIYDDYGDAQPNRDFTVVLSNPQVDWMESWEVPPPQLDPSFSRILVRILDTDISARGPSSKTDTNSVPPTVYSLEPTNAIFNFQKANYRITRDSKDYWKATPITLYVNRTGTNKASDTVNWRVNNYFKSSVLNENRNNQFPLQPGSDYATPNPENDGGIKGLNPDFSFSAYSGTLTFPNKNPQPITFEVLNHGDQQFNEDFVVELYQVDDGKVIPCGMVDQAKVTILYDDLTPPAGSVDQFHNADFNTTMAVPTDLLQSTTPPNMAHPGTDGQVLGLTVLKNGLVQTNFTVVTNNGVLETNITTTVLAADKTVIVGDFFSYDQASRNRIAGVNIDGSLDTSFNPGSGANAFISAIDQTPNGQLIIGGAFTSYNGTLRNRIARLNSNGALDNTFAPGFGANGTIRAVAVQADGKIMIGGDFTSYGGTPRNYLARLNANGTLDTTFNPGTGLNGPVFSIGLEPTTTISLDRSALGDDQEDRQDINLGSTNAGVLTIDYDMLFVPDLLRVYYNGVKLYDTGYVADTGHLVIPFPGGTNVITIVINEGGGNIGTVWDYVAQAQITGASQVYVGGDFTAVGGVLGQDHFTRILNDGSVDQTFNPGAGANGTVYAIAVQPDSKVLVGGEFSQVNGKELHRIARLNLDGSLDADFFVSSGINDTVYNLNVQTNGTIYVGGAFTSINDTHRLGFARLNADGAVDTTFLDTAYNQFAGLPRRYIDDAPGTVLTSGIQSDGKVLIGGSFQFVGGGQFNRNVRNNTQEGYDADVWPEPKTRDGIRSRSNFARLIGGATPGPGNISLLFDNYSVTRSESALYVSLLRTNGTLGSASANFSVNPGTAETSRDFIYNGDSPLYWIAWQSFTTSTRMHSDGLFGTNTFLSDIYGDYWWGWPETLQSAVTVSVVNNALNSGDAAAQFQLANPSGADQFYLGGQNIPLGVALGRSAAPFNIIDDHHDSGVFGFASSSITATGNVAVTVSRANGTYGLVSMNFSTNSGGTAIYGSDFRLGSAVGTLNFANGETSRSFNVQILNSNSVSAVEKTINLRLFNLNAPANGVASFGLTNTVLRIINPNFQGYLNFQTNAYATNVTAGMVAVTVTRSVGSKGTLTVQYATSNGTALSGIDYTGTTNSLQWDSGDVSPRAILIPISENNTIGANKQFTIALLNPKVNGVTSGALLGATANAVVTIVNDNNYGTFQFSASSYTVNENGGYATVTVNRSGSALGSVTVNFGTANDTAVAGVNYVTTNGSLSFAPGQLSATFRVPILNDGAMDIPPNSSFRVSLSVPPEALAGSLTNVPVYIIDADSFNRPPGSPDIVFDSNTVLNDDVLALALQSDGRIIAGGNFTKVNGIPESHLARINANGTLDQLGFLNGLAGANGSVRALVNQSNDRVVIGGAFTFVNGVVRNYIARLNTDGSLDTGFNPGSGANNTVFALAETFLDGNRKIYAGGAFTMMNAVPSFGIARLNDNGTVDTSFSVVADGTVYAIAVYPTNSVYAGKVVVGGTFTSINGQAVSRIARLNRDGSVDTTFALNLGADDVVRALAIQDDGGVVVGGDFSTINNVSANRIARFNVDGSLDATFVTNLGLGANGNVNSIALQADQRIVLAGQFTQINGLSHHRISRLLPDGKVDPTINFGTGADADIDAVVVQPNDGMLVVGGGFDHFNGEAHAHIARIYSGSVTGSGAFEFTAGGYQVNENGTYGYVTVRRVGGTSGPNADGSGNIVLNFLTSNGSAVAGVNYVAINTNLSFPPGEVLQTIAVPVIDDLTISSNLTVNLTISNPTSPAGLGDQSTTVLTILNTDGSISFSSSGYTVPKNIFTGEAVIDIVRQGSTSGSASVTFATTTNGTAVTNFNYLATTQTVTFLPGETLKSVAIPVIDNSVPEGNKTVSLALSDAIGASLGNPSTATLTILDTVVAPGLLSLESSSYVVAEGDGVATISVVRTSGSSGNVSVNYTTVPGTAVNGVNYFTTSGSLNFVDGQTNRTFTVPLIDNSLVQGNVSFSVQLSNPTAGALLISPTNATVAVLENDEALTVIPSGSALITESHPNSIIDTNETVTMAFGFRVSAGTNLTSLVATLLQTNGVTSVTPASQDYGALVVRGPSASRSFSFSVDSTYTNGQPIAAVFALSEAGHYIGTTQFNFVLGSSTKTFSSTNAIVITDSTNATPYPSTIVVSGLGDSLVKATVSLNKVGHTWPADVDVMMQSPAQQKILLMANAGSGNQVNNLNLIFDDAAAGFLPSGLISSGSYRPTAYFPLTTFPSPAPAGPYSTNLSTLNGNNPNGTWSLFVMDDSPFNSGGISNGWSLTLSTLAVVSSSADVGVSVIASADTVALGANLTYMVAVTNYGPGASTGVNLTNILPAGMTYVSSSATVGTPLVSGGTITWNVGSLAVNDGAQLTITATAVATGVQLTSAVVTSTSSDANPSDDSASVAVTVGTAEPPQMSASLVNGNGEFQLSIVGAAIPTVIQASTDMSNWVPVYTNLPPFTFTDPNAASYPARFYRAVLGH